MLIIRSPEDAFKLLKSSISHLDVCNALELNPKHILFILNNTDTDHYYTRFDILKKSGKFREICRPHGGLALAQENLAQILNFAYKPKSHVRGFVKGESFLTNARYHVGGKWVLNVDVENFFPSITFPRVRGLFLSSTFKFSPTVATCLARIVTHKGSLPQGAKTSPVISNMIAFNLDKALIVIARNNKVKFSRYADDITFSSTRRLIPEDLIKEILPVSGEKGITLAKELKDAFYASGFQINHRKTRIQMTNERQEVTGLTVNKKANVRRTDIGRVRMWLHSAAKHGDVKAAALWIGAKATPEDFWRFIVGWLSYIGQVKGRDDSTLAKLCSDAAKINKNLPKWIIKQADMVMEFDIFLSHASEDKPKVKKLKDKLERVGLTVFFDETSILWGDSIVEKINHGLRTSKLFVPILSHTFSAKGWTNKELNSAIKATIDRESRLLPISLEGFDIGERYPLLDDTLYKTWPSGESDEEKFINEVADALLAIVSTIKSP